MQVSHFHIDCSIEKAVDFIREGYIVQLSWDEEKDLLEKLNHYFVSVSNGYTTKVKGNAIVLKDMQGKNFERLGKYHVNVSAIDNDHNQRLVLHETFEFANFAYKQEFIDKMAHDIARKLNASEEKQERNFSDVFAELYQPWSYPVVLVILVISNDATVYGGYDGLKNPNIRKKDACKHLDISITKCKQVTLKDGDKGIHVFTWPKENEYAEGLIVQLRFSYAYNPHFWYATKIYPLDETSLIEDETKTKTETSQSTSSKYRNSNIFHETKKNIDYTSPTPEMHSNGAEKDHKIMAKSREFAEKVDPQMTGKFGEDE
ncbi:hypothetical protein Ciccas_013286 [Cichlidogyrus casuarinus]|uniref:Uncharacterized protein n=1 Tax=Cichlidogyrus casuarinus TaxID=1844966 RepID=A0ABD2PP06_9PLAT